MIDFSQELKSFPRKQRLRFRYNGFSYKYREEIRLGLSILIRFTKVFEMNTGLKVFEIKTGFKPV